MLRSHTAERQRQQFPVASLLLIHLSDRELGLDVSTAHDCGQGETATQGVEVTGAGGVVWAATSLPLQDRGGVYCVDNAVADTAARLRPSVWWYGPCDCVA